MRCLKLVQGQWCFVPNSRLDSVILPAEFAWHCHITMFKTESPENLEPPGDFPACLLSQGGGGWPT